MKQKKIHSKLPSSFHFYTNKNNTKKKQAFWYISTPGKAGDVFGNHNQWDGLGIMLDSFDNDNRANNPYVSVILSNGDKIYNKGADGMGQEVGGCQYNFRNPRDSIVMDVRYQNKKLSVSFGHRSDELKNFYKCLHEVYIGDLPSPGYFGITAETGGVVDVHDVKSLNVFDLNPTYTPPADIYTENDNLQREAQRRKEQQQKEQEEEQDEPNEAPSKKNKRIKRDKIKKIPKSEERETERAEKKREREEAKERERKIKRILDEDDEDDDELSDDEFDSIKSMLEKEDQKKFPDPLPLRDPMKKYDDVKKDLEKMENNNDKPTHKPVDIHVETPKKEALTGGALSKRSFEQMLSLVKLLEQQQVKMARAFDSILTSLDEEKEYQMEQYATFANSFRGIYENIISRGDLNRLYKNSQRLEHILPKLEVISRYIKKIENRVYPHKANAPHNNMINVQRELHSVVNQKSQHDQRLRMQVSNLSNLLNSIHVSLDDKKPEGSLLFYIITFQSLLFFCFVIYSLISSKSKKY